MIDGLVLYGKIVKQWNGKVKVYICMLHYTLPLLLGLIVDWKIVNRYGA